MELLRGMRNLEDDAAGAWRLKRKRSKKLDRIKCSHCRIYSAGKHRARIVQVLRGGGILFLPNCQRSFLLCYTTLRDT